MRSPNPSPLTSPAEATEPRVPQARGGAEPIPLAPVEAPASSSRVPLLVVTGAALALSGASLGLAAGARAQFDKTTDASALDGLAARNHAFLIGSAGLGAVALGSGVTLAVTW